MVIKILGMGWPKCNQLENTTREVVKEMKIDAQIEHVRDIKKIMEYAVMKTPALVIDEKVICSGRAPSKEEVKTFLNKAMGTGNTITKD